MVEPLPDATVIRPRVFARERLNTVAEPASKPYAVFACCELQDAFVTLGEAEACARRLVLKHPGVAVQVLQLIKTLRTATVIQEL